MEQNGVPRPLAADLPPEVKALAQFLRTLVASLGTSPDRYSSWALNDPDAMRHYLDGSRLPPRDVVSGLIRHLAEHRGVRLEPEARRRAEELHAAAVRAVDADPSRVEELRAELDAMDTGLERTARREQQLLGDVRAQQAAVQGGAVEHADYRRRLIAIHEELRRVRRQRALAETRRAELAERLAAAEERHQRTARPARRARPTGARFAGAYTEPEAAPAARPAPEADTAEPPPTGARFGGAAPARRRFARRNGTERAPGPKAAPGQDTVRAELARDPDAKELAEAVIRLRGEGRAQEAQRLLWAASAWAPERFPALLAALSVAGLRTDANVLVWELSSRSPQEVAAFSAWLVKCGLAEECRELLVHASSRAHADVAAAALALAEAGWRDQANLLLGTVTRVRPPEVVAGLAGDLASAEATSLLRELLGAVAAVPRDRQLLIAAAMRVAGLTETAADIRG